MKQNNETARTCGAQMPLAELLRQHHLWQLGSLAALRAPGLSVDRVLHGPTVCVSRAEREQSQTPKTLVARTATLMNYRAGILYCYSLATPAITLKPPAMIAMLL
jgi:hypothetical protein